MVLLDLCAITAVGDAVFFIAYDDRGRELWRSDGTSAGTSIVVDLNPGPADAVLGQPRPRRPRRRSRSSPATTGSRGPSLWKVTETSTVPTCKGVAATVTGTGRITGTSGADVIVGSSAADIIDGRGGDDLICARGGDDRVLQGVNADGADTVVGGTGTDAVSYASRSARISVSLPDRDANDGAFGEHDKLVGIEDVRGGAGHDKIIGNFADNSLFGGAGDDALTGNKVTTSSRGEAGDDALVPARRDGRERRRRRRRRQRHRDVRPGRRRDGRALTAPMKARSPACSDLESSGEQRATQSKGSRHPAPRDAESGPPSYASPCRCVRGDGCRSHPDRIDFARVRLRVRGGDVVSYVASHRNPIAFTAVGNTLYFGALDDAHGREPWKSPTAPAKARRLVADIYPGPDGEGRPDILGAHDGLLYFTAFDGVHGREDVDLRQHGLRFAQSQRPRPGRRHRSIASAQRR